MTDTRQNKGLIKLGLKQHGLLQEESGEKRVSELQLCVQRTTCRTNSCNASLARAPGWLVHGVYVRTLVCVRV